MRDVPSVRAAVAFHILTPSDRWSGQWINIAYHSPLIRLSPTNRRRGLELFFFLAEMREETQRGKEREREREGERERERER